MKPKNVVPAGYLAGYLAVLLGVFAVVFLTALLGGGCTRPIGSYFRHEDEPIPWVTETCAYMGGVDPEAPWPMFQRCPSHAGVGPHLGPGTASVRWRVDCETTLEGFVVTADGAIFGCGDNAYELAARDPVDGDILWSSQGGLDQGALFAGIPAIDAAGTIYAANTRGMSAFAAAGEIRWSSSRTASRRASTSTPTSPAPPPSAPSW